MASCVVPLASVVLMALASPALAACPNRAAKEDFNSTEFMGKWYMQKVVQTPGYANTKCNQMTITQGENELLLNIKYLNLTNAKDTHILAKIRKADDASEEAKFTYFREGVFSHDTTSFVITNTDYGNYAVVAFCDTNKNIKTVFLLTRKRSPTDEELEAGTDALPSDVTYVKQSQDDCQEHTHDA